MPDIQALSAATRAAALCYHIFMPEDPKKTDDAWYSGLPESEEDRLYTESVNRIKTAVEQGLGFEEAAKLVEVKDAEARESILDDALKVIIAEMHFAKQEQLEKLAKKLKLPIEKLMKARQEMLADVELAAIEKFKEETGQSGNA